MATEERQLAGTTNADARTVLSNLDLDDPNKTVSDIRVSPGIFDYTKAKDVDYYIEFTAFKYSRGISGGSVGRGKELIIRLPLLSSIRMAYEMNYTSKDMALFYDAAAGLVEAAGSISGDFSNAVGTAVKSVKQGTGAVAQTAYNALGGGGEYTEQLNNVLGVAKNPRMEASFVGIGMRNHSFGFVLVPRNAAENEIIQSIIFAFKHRMHPGVTDGALADAFLKFPDEFTIAFKSTRDGSLLKIPTIPDCFLASFGVEYNQNGMARFFDDNNPVSYRIDMAFVEGNQLTRREIEAGGY